MKNPALFKKYSSFTKKVQVYRSDTTQTYGMPTAFTHDIKNRTWSVKLDNGSVYPITKTFFDKASNYAGEMVIIIRGDKRILLTESGILSTPEPPAPAPPTKDSTTSQQHHKKAMRQRTYPRLPNNCKC